MVLNVKSNGKKHLKNILITMVNNKTNLIIFIIYIVTLVIISKGLNNSYLWFDEAGQFWISKGLNHYSQPLAKTEGLLNVVLNNSRYNLDPGGFSILLHLWSYFSNSTFWLRLLPFSFFTFTSFLFIWFSYNWIKKIDIALLLGLLPFLFSAIVQMAFEVRAYSMEYLGVMLLIVGVYCIRRNLTKKMLLYWSILFSIFMGSRYSIIVIVFITSLYIFFEIIFSHKSLRDKTLSILIFSLPISVALVLIYYFSLSTQNPELRQLSYLSYLNNDWTILLKPFTNLMYLLFVILVFSLIIFSLISKKKMLTKYMPLFIISSISNIAFIILSFLGKYPWNPLSKYGLPYFILTLLCLSAILGEILNHLLNKPNILMSISLIMSHKVV